MRHGGQPPELPASQCPHPAPPSGARGPWRHLRRWPAGRQAGGPNPGAGCQPGWGRSWFHGTVTVGDGMPRRDISRHAGVTSGWSRCSMFPCHLSVRVGTWAMCQRCASPRQHSSGGEDITSYDPTSWSLQSGPSPAWLGAAVTNPGSCALMDDSGRGWSKLRDSPPGLSPPPVIGVPGWATPSAQGRIGLSGGSRAVPVSPGLAWGITDVRTRLLSLHGHEGRRRDSGAAKLFSVALTSGDPQRCGGVEHQALLSPLRSPLLRSRGIVAHLQ